MIERPSWEKPLRQRLRKRRKLRLKPRWLVDQAGTIIVLFVLQCLLAHGGEETLGTGGGGTGIGAVSGLIGALLAMSLRSRWQEHGWLANWTPASPAVAWRVKTREHLPVIAFTVVATLLLSCLAASFNDQTSVLSGLAAAALSMAFGFLLAGGRVSTGLLYSGVILAFFYTVIGGWFEFGESELSLRMAKGTSFVWLPILPWSLATHGTPATALHLGLLIAALLISVYEWKLALRERSDTANASYPIEMPSALADEDEARDAAPEAEETLPDPDETQRQNIRQHVAFAWFGMAGYLPDGPMPRFERLLWRWLNPRQRFLSCLGSQQAAAWFPRTRWTAGVLALMVALASLVPLLDVRELIADYGFWALVGFLGLGSLATVIGWPGRDSCFQSWLELMHTADLGLFPSFAVLPVTAGEWLGAFAKEWTLRGAWFSVLWSIAIVLGLRGIAPDTPFSWQMAFVALPWLLITSWFPLSVLHRLVRAVSGPAFRNHGITRVLPALVSGVIGVIAMTVAIMGIGAGVLVLTLGSLAVAALFNALSLWLTLQRCRGMRLDLKPEPLV